jgi:hypothetical protein
MVAPRLRWKISKWNNAKGTSPFSISQLVECILTDTPRLLCSSHVELIPKTTGAIHDQKSERTNSFDPDGQRPKWEYTGWRAGGLKFSIIALVVLVTNFISLIWSVTNYTIEDGYSVLYSGNCATGRKISTALHLLINILSTTLLTASNYIMQCLSSPTREDLDRAHAGKEWADIGIPSWRNRRFVSPQKRMLWWLLGISSIPLHFLCVIKSYLESY